MALQLQGIAVSRGVAIGLAHVLLRDTPEAIESLIPAERVEQEVSAFEQALDSACTQLQALRDRIPAQLPVDIGGFIDTHLMMLRDPMLRDGPVGIIREQMCNAAWALKLQRDALIAVFEAMDDSYLRNRKDDVDHVVQRIHRALAQPSEEEVESTDNWRGKIIVADDLTPADTVLMEHHGVAGFVTESGGQLSHTAILARSLGIPAVVGVHGARHTLHEGDRVIVDGGEGLVLIDPEAKVVRKYQRRRGALRRQRSELAQTRDEPAITADGVAIDLQVNIEVEADLRAMRRVNPAGVGLYRTEFLYMNRTDPPDEQEHYKTYLNAVRALRGRPLTIRTVDLGADKEVDETQVGPLAHNPAMGLRGIRRCLHDPDLFLPQLRAILRAGASGPVRVMFPMLTSIDEVHQGVELLAACRESLQAAGQAVAEQLEVGGMVEVPATAITAGLFAQNLDFMSIGTNDLIQYTLAIDRIDDQVNYLYDPLHPAVLTLIHNIILAGAKHRIPVSMCGEMAGDVRYVRLLLGLGLRAFSMPPNSLLEVKRVINNSRIASLEKPALKLLDCCNTDERASLLERLNRHLEDLSLPL